MCVVVFPLFYFLFGLWDLLWILYYEDYSSRPCSSRDVLYTSKTNPFFFLSLSNWLCCYTGFSKEWTNNDWIVNDAARRTVLFIVYTKRPFHSYVLHIHICCLQVSSMHWFKQFGNTNSYSIWIAVWSLYGMVAAVVAAANVLNGVNHCLVLQFDYVIFVTSYDWLHLCFIIYINDRFIYIFAIPMHFRQRELLDTRNPKLILRKGNPLRFTNFTCTQPFQLNSIANTICMTHKVV